MMSGLNDNLVPQVTKLKQQLLERGWMKTGIIFLFSAIIFVALRLGIRSSGNRLEPAKLFTFFFFPQLREGMWV